MLDARSLSGGLGNVSSRCKHISLLLNLTLSLISARPSHCKRMELIVASGFWLAS